MVRTCIIALTDALNRHRSIDQPLPFRQAQSRPRPPTPKHPPATSRALAALLSSPRSTMFDFLKGFDINSLRPHLKMAVQRIGIATNKKTQGIKYVRGIVRAGVDWKTPFGCF